jgi:hypothetical protein
VVWSPAGVLFSSIQIRFTGYFSTWANFIYMVPVPHLYIKCEKLITEDRRYCGLVTPAVFIHIRFIRLRNWVLATGKALPLHVHVASNN